MTEPEECGCLPTVESVAVIQWIGLLLLEAILSSFIPSGHVPSLSMAEVGALHLTNVG